MFLGIYKEILSMEKYDELINILFKIQIYNSIIKEYTAVQCKILTVIALLTVKHCMRKKHACKL